MTYILSNPDEKSVFVEILIIAWALLGCSSCILSEHSQPSPLKRTLYEDR